MASTDDAPRRPSWISSNDAAGPPDVAQAAAPTPAASPPWVSISDVAKPSPGVKADLEKEPVRRAAGAADLVDRTPRWISKRKPLLAAVGAAALMGIFALLALLRGGETKKVEPAIAEKGSPAKPSSAAVEIERKEAEFRFEEAIQECSALIRRATHPAEKSLLQQRLEDLRLQRELLEGLVDRIRKEPKDFSELRLKTGRLEDARVLDATTHRIIVRHWDKISDPAWGDVDPRQFAKLVKDWWPDIAGRPALGFGVWCARHGLMDEAAFAVQKQPAPDAKPEEPSARATPEPVKEPPKGSPPAPAPNPAVYETAIRRGNEKRAAKDLAGAIAEYSAALAERKDDPQALALRAQTRFDLKQFDASVEDCSAALRGEPGAAKNSLFALRARGRSALGDFAGAVADYDEAIELDATSASLRSERGRIHYRQRRYDKAIADFTRAMDLQPASGDEVHLRGLCHCDTGNWKAAAADFRRATGLGSWSTDHAWIGLWVSRARLGEQTLASKELKTYASGRQGPKEEWFRKVVLFLTGELSEELLHAYSVEPLDERDRREWQCEAFYYAATKRALAGDTAGAETLFRKCLETGVTAFPEYLGAQSELEALAGKRPSG